MKIRLFVRELSPLRYSLFLSWLLSSLADDLRGTAGEKLGETREVQVPFPLREKSLHVLQILP